MPLKLMYITNKLDTALIAEKYGVDRVWVDLETLGKEQRQPGMDTVKSQHAVSDIVAISPHLTSSEMLVRINPWNEGSRKEIDQVVSAGADIIMLPYWKTEKEVESFIDAVGGRCKTTLLLETKEAHECLENVLSIQGIDEMHIGLNDLHLSYGLSFMFELLINGVVDDICCKIKNHGIPFGIGGIARLGAGALPADKIIMEHYRLGSTRAILSRSFCNYELIGDIGLFEDVFSTEMHKLRTYETVIEGLSEEEYKSNHEQIKLIINEIVGGKNNENTQ